MQAGGGVTRTFSPCCTPSSRCSQHQSFVSPTLLPLAPQPHHLVFPLNGPSSPPPSLKPTLNTSTTMSSKPTNKPRRKVAVVGSGIAGLSAAWALHNSKSYEVHIYEEASDHLGGHTNRVPFSHSSGKRINVDTGFVILNAETYRIPPPHPRSSG